MGVVRVKDGVLFTTIAPAGFRLLAAIDAAATALNRDLTITSACDGVHSGESDPHHLGEAYDVRTDDMPDDATKQAALTAILAPLDPAHFFGFLESPGTPNEHIHCQRRRDTTYP